MDITTRAIIVGIGIICLMSMFIFLLYILIRAIIDDW